MPELIFLDTETTDLENGRLIELGISIEGHAPESYRFKPPHRISIEAMSVHHITEKAIAGELLFKEWPAYEEMKAQIEQGIVIAHNAPFDNGVLLREGIYVKRYIDTKRLAELLIPESPRSSLQYLRYFLNLDVEGEAHSAGGDVNVLIALYSVLRERLRIRDGIKDETVLIERLEALSKDPILLREMPFGKHKGKGFDWIKAIHPDYLVWADNENFDNENLNYTVKYWLKNDA